MSATWPGPVIPEELCVTDGYSDPPILPVREAAPSGALQSVAESLCSAIEADGAIVTWNDGEAGSTVLCSSGSTILDATSTDRSAANDDPIYFTDRSGMHWETLTTSIPVERGTVTMRACFRSLGGGARHRLRASLGAMAPLLYGLFAMWKLERNSSVRLAALTNALQTTGMGVIAIDNAGQVLFANRSAERILDARDGMRRSGGSIAATNLGDSIRLHAAIEHVRSSAEDAETHDGEPSPVVALRRNHDRRPLMAAIVPGERFDAASAATATIYLFDPGEDLCRRLEPACRYYKLSRVETRLACLLAEGATLCQACERLRVREQTGRSYLKQIFLKTETSRQAELVSVLLKSCIHTAAGHSMDLV